MVDRSSLDFQCSNTLHESPDLSKEMIGNIDVRSGWRLVRRMTSSGTAWGAVYVPVALSLFIVRGILFHPGWIEYSADFTVSIHHTVEWQNWATAWNRSLGTSNAATLSLAPPNLLLLTLFGTATAQKLLLTSGYVLMASAMFSTLRWWLRRHAIEQTAIAWAILGSVIFTVNGWVAIESVHLYFLFMYALLPLTFRLTVMALEQSLCTTRLLLALASGMVALGTFTAYGIVFHALLVGVLAVIWVLWGRHDWWVRLRRALGFVAVYIWAVSVGGSYWLLPTVFGFKTNYSSGTSWAVFTTRDMFTLSYYTPLKDATRGMYRNLSSSLATMVLGHTGFVIGASLLFLLGILALGNLLMDWSDWTITGLIFAALMFAFMANGTNLPSGNNYARLAYAPGLRQINYVLFKGPYKLVPELIFCLTMLAIATLARIWTRRAYRVLALISATGLVVGSGLIGSPLLTGDLAGYMRPIKPPSSYLSALKRLSGEESANGPGRTVWLPIDSTGDGAPPVWAPGRKPLPLIGGGLPPEPSWLAPTPVSSRSVTWLGPASGRIFDELFSNAVRNVPQADLGALLKSGGRRYAVVRLDAGSRLGQLPVALARGKGLKRIASNEWLTAYASAPPSIHPVKQVDIALGGEEQLIINSARGRFNAASRPLVLAAEIPRSRRLVKQLLSQAGEISFSPGQRWSDLALDSWSGPGVIVDLAGTVQLSTPLSPWDKDAFNSNIWIPDRLAGMAGQKFSPSISPIFLVAHSAASTSTKVCTAAGNHELWVRLLASPLGGRVSAVLDGRTIGSVDVTARTVEGWVWDKLGTYSTPGGCSSLTISVDGALSALDEAAVLPAGAVLNTVQVLQSQMAATNIASGGFWGDLHSTAGNRSSVGKFLGLSIVSGQLQGEPKSLALPITLRGFANAASRFFAARLSLRPTDLSNSQQLSLRVDTHGSVPLADLSVGLTDVQGATVVCPSAVNGRSLSVYLFARQCEMVPKDTTGASFDFSAVDGMELITKSNIAPRTDLRITITQINASIYSPSKTIYVPREGTYRLVLGRATPVPTESALVDGTSVILHASNGWEISTPVKLREGRVTVSATSALATWDIVELFNSPAGDPWSESGELSPAQMGATAGPSSVLVTSTPFNPQWQLAGAAPVGHLPLNGFVNGYVVNGYVVNGARVPSETFGPNRWLFLGRLISSLFVSGTLIAYVLWKSRRTSFWPGSRGRSGA